jgi:hypothetical protein
MVFTLGGKAYAASLFELTVTSEGETYSQGFSSVADLLDNFSVDRIQDHIQNYTDQSLVEAELDFRGLPIRVFIEGGVNSAVHLVIPSIGVDKWFIESTRQASIDALVDWFEGKGDEALADMARYLAAETPTDPVAGNPASLLGVTTASDFATGFMDQVSAFETGLELSTLAPGEQSANANLVALQTSIGRVRMGEFNGTYYRLPLSYTFRANSDARRRIKISVPVGVLIVDGARSYTGGLGLAVSLPVNKVWVLTPAASYAAAGSQDFASAAHLFSASLTSALSLPAGPLTLNIGNMVGYYQTLPFHYKEVQYDPRLRNWAVRNGVMVGFPLGKTLSGEVFATDTRYFGTDLFVDQSNEVGFSLGFRKSADKKKGNKVIHTLQSLRVGSTFVFGRDYRSWEFNAGYTF